MPVSVEICSHAFSLICSLNLWIITVIMNSITGERATVVMYVTRCGMFQHVSGARDHQLHVKSFNDTSYLKSHSKVPFKSRILKSPIQKSHSKSYSKVPLKSPIQKSYSKVPLKSPIQKSHSKVLLKVPFNLPWQLFCSTINNESYQTFFHPLILEVTRAATY